MPSRITRMLALLAGLIAAASDATAQSPGDSIRLTLHSTEIVRGGFLERSSDAWRLAVPAANPRLVATLDVRRAEVQRLRSRSQLRSKSMFTGMLIGAAAGIAVFSSEVAAQPGEAGLGGLVIIPMTVGGAAYGAGIGWIVGSLRPLAVWRELP